MFAHAAALSALLVTNVVIGVELPFAGSDGADGLQAREGVELAVADSQARGAALRVRLVFRDSARHIQNPHEDEGSDPIDEPQRGAAIVHAFAVDPRISGIIGALHADVAAAEASMLRGRGIALVSGGATQGFYGALFAVAGPRSPRAPASFMHRFRTRYLEAPAPEALRFYAATQVLLGALERARGSRRDVLQTLRAECPQSLCPAPRVR